MTTTSELVAILVRDLSPAPKAWVARRLAVGFLGGAIAAAICVVTLWGIRPDFGAAIWTGPFWAKLLYTGMIAGLGLAAAACLSRPGSSGWRYVVNTMIVIAAMAVCAALQLEQAPAGTDLKLIMGSSASSCPWLIMLLSLPIFAGGLWAIRAMAPIHLARAGAAVGLAAGALAAFVYATSCGESGIAFVLVWYSLGIAAPTIAGALLGARLLHW